MKVGLERVAAVGEAHLRPFEEKPMRVEDLEHVRLAAAADVLRTGHHRLQDGDRLSLVLLPEQPALDDLKLYPKRAACAKNTSTMSTRPDKNFLY